MMHTHPELRAALDYAQDWKADFFEYLDELLVCTDCPAETAALARLLRDFRDHWGGKLDFETWQAQEAEHSVCTEEF